MIQMATMSQTLRSGPGPGAVLDVTQTTSTSRSSRSALCLRGRRSIRLFFPLYTVHWQVHWRSTRQCTCGRQALTRATTRFILVVVILSLRRSFKSARRIRRSYVLFVIFVLLRAQNNTVLYMYSYNNNTSMWPCV